MNYAYYRCSTQSQMDANGFQMQENVVTNYCKEHNIVIDDVFTDGGISGTKFDRDGIMDLLAILKKNDKIIVQNTSRLWREEFATAFIKRELRKIGAIIISVENPNYDLYAHDPGDVFMARIMEAVDEFEKMQIALKLAKGRKAKANKGNKACGIAPIGYKWNDAKIEVDAENKEMIVDIFNQYLKLRSLGKLQKYCDERNYITSHGKPFSKQSLSNILSNDFYIGVVTHAEKKVSGNHVAIIDISLYNEANKILKRA